MFKNNISLIDSDKTRKPAASGDWMSQLKKTKTIQQEQDVQKAKPSAKKRDNVISLDTSDDELRFESDDNVMVVDGFIKKETKASKSSPLLIDEEEDEPDPYEHTFTSRERDRLYEGERQEVECDQKNWRRMLPAPQLGLRLRPDHPIRNGE